VSRVVIESPCGSEDPAIVERNLTYLRRALADCLRRGESPYASHGLYTQPGVLDDNDPEERARGIEAGFEWVGEYVVVYEDYGISPGMTAGIGLRLGRGEAVVYRTIGENP
jgi:hypothetical protein